MKTEYIILKKAILPNHCPECYAKESLELSFQQKKVTSPWIIRMKSDIHEQMVCTHCGSTIFPGQRDKDIERVYDYHKKTIDTPKSLLQFTSLFYGVAVLVGLICASTIGYFMFY